MTTPAVIIEERDDRILVRLDRPKVHNAIDRQMVAELHLACDLVERSPKIVILMGSGSTFAAGADIGELRERRRDDALAGVNSTLFDRIHRLPLPTIALIDGHALGGGAELAYACDFRIGTPTTRIGNPEPSLGIVAGAGATWRLAELVGEPLAKEVLLAGRVLDASEALEAHLLNEVVQAGDLLEAGNRWADRMSSQSMLALRLTKSVFHAPRDAHPMIDNLAQAILFETDDKHQRMTKFLDRRKVTE